MLEKRPSCWVLTNVDEMGATPQAAAEAHIEGSRYCSLLT